MGIEYACANSGYIFLKVVYCFTKLLDFDRLGNTMILEPANGVSKLLRVTTSHKDAPGRAGVGSYFSRQEASLTCCHWQVKYYSFQLIFLLNFTL